MTPHQAAVYINGNPEEFLQHYHHHTLHHDDTASHRDQDTPQRYLDRNKRSKNSATAPALAPALALVSVRRAYRRYLALAIKELTAMVVALTAGCSEDEREGVVTRAVREGTEEKGALTEGVDGDGDGVGEEANAKEGKEVGGGGNGEEGGAKEEEEEEEDVLGLERRLCGVLNDMALVDVPADTVAKRLWQLPIQ